MPICKITLIAKKPISKAYPVVLNSIGDHIRKRRVELKLFQKDVAELIGVQTDSIVNWELNRFTPQVHQLPKIIEFLGYVPFGISGDTFSSKVKAFRKEARIESKKACHVVGC
ncbi:MAG TPA: helix-turn-helix transcriptional regulator [Ignavibacteriaceae bacterium]|nr:helix-turn-helix transcriptional regulator [Ignavibacteriaceae bacterium]